MTESEKKIKTLFRELVPVSGKADTVAGEILRAIGRISRRNYNDGEHIGVGDGTCNSAARYLMARAGDKAEGIIQSIWGVEFDVYYNSAVSVLEDEVVAFLEQHPELRETPNDEDMLDF